MRLRAHRLEVQPDSAAGPRPAPSPRRYGWWSMPAGPICLLFVAGARELAD